MNLCFRRVIEFCIVLKLLEEQRRDKMPAAICGFVTFRKILGKVGCIITGLFISFKMHYENVSMKEAISAD
jgi:hypothetical protein